MKKTKMTRTQVKRTDVLVFARMFQVKLSMRIGAFLARHSIENIGILLDTSVIHEKDVLWRDFSGLRETLKRMGFSNGKREYKFLVTTI